MRDSEIWGYARVSSSAQNLERQFEQFRAYGIDERHIVAEKQSGKDFDRRGFNSLVGTDESVPSLRAGDTLVICSIDRLGRNYSEVQHWWHYITETLKCSIVVLDMPLLCTKDGDGSLERSLLSDIWLQFLSYVAEKERIAIHERQRQGIEVAKAQGVKFGRKKIQKPEGFDEIAKKWKTHEITAVEAMKVLGLKKHSFYRLMKEEGYYV